MEANANEKANALNGKIEPMRSLEQKQNGIGLIGEQNGSKQVPATDKHNASQSERSLSQPELTRWQKFRICYRTLSIILHNVYCIPSYLVWMLVLRPLLYFNAELYWQIEGVLYNWLLSIVGFWIQSADFTVVESGVDVNDFVDDEALVLCNHQSTGDVPLVMYICGHHKGVHQSMLWIMESVFKYTNFGWVSQVHGDFFILQGKATRSQELDKLKQHLQTLYVERDRKWILLFPEGGFLRKRRETSQKYAKANGYPVLEHVTLPRIGAMKAVLDSQSHPEDKGKGNPKRIKWLIDVTVAYPDGGKPLDAFSILGAHRAPCETKVHYRVFPVDEIPNEENAMLQWLYQRWEEKEKLLATVYETGKFPQNEVDREGQTPRGKGITLKNERKLHYDEVWIVCLHLFFLISMYVQYSIARDVIGLFY